MAPFIISSNWTNFRGNLEAAVSGINLSLGMRAKNDVGITSFLFFLYVLVIKEKDVRFVLLIRSLL